MSIEDFLSKETFTLKALKKFSVAANKSNGRGHPADDERWMEFLIIAHQNNEPLTASQLRQWLIQEGRWPEEIASYLCSDYEYGRDLLSKYDEK